MSSAYATDPRIVEADQLSDQIRILDQAQLPRLAQGPPRKAARCRKT
jgi:hypothetical protein